MRYGVDNVDDLFRGAVGVARLCLMGLHHIWVGVPCCKHDVGDIGMKPNSTVGIRDEAIPPWVRPRTKLTRPDGMIRKKYLTDICVDRALMVYERLGCIDSNMRTAMLYLAAFCMQS